MIIDGVQNLRTSANDWQIRGNIVESVFVENLVSQFAVDLIHAFDIV